MTMTSGSGTYIGYEPPGSKAPLGSEPPRRRKGGWIAVVATALVVGALSGASAAVLIDDEPAAPVVIEVPVAAEPVSPPDTDAPTILGVDPAAVGATVIPSIVTVQVGSTQNGEFVATASGSGVVFDPSHIITNHHVIDGATAVKVVLSDGRVYDAEIVGSDPITDVGVLELETTDLVPLALGAADTLTVGMPAIAVGSPLGLDGGPSLSVGVISALGREVQTGPEVVARVANEIIATGSASHALLGILGSTSYESIADSGVMPVGVTVEEVTEFSSAAVAGIAVGQVITFVDGVPVRTMDELITALHHYSAGETVTVQLTDGGTVTLELGARE